MTNIEELNLYLKKLNKKNTIYLLIIVINIALIIFGILCKIPTLNGLSVAIGMMLLIIFGILKSKNSNKIFKTKKQIYEIETMKKAIEDSRK